MTYEHDEHDDHDHDDHDRPDEPIEANPIWQQDNVTLHSVGIDIGSSGTQVAFSRLHLRRMGEDLTSRYVVVERETQFQSEVVLTPYTDGTLIDTAALGEILDAAYRDGRQTPEDIDTGVVILTGEALRRRNAGRIADIVSAQAGDLVCASAGHHMEAMLAAYGSGAARRSYDSASRILNVDIGGGTTKLSLVADGRILATAALHVGGRLQVMDRELRIVRLEPGGSRHSEAAGFDWQLGDAVRPEELDRVAEVMADAVVAAVRGDGVDEGVAALFLTEPIEAVGAIDGVMFSGGVAEYVYGRESRDFGDLGRRLGAALRRRIDAGALPAPVLPAGECIRATVLGASEYSVQLSGNTCYLPDADRVLPRRNLQVIRPHYVLGEAVDAGSVAAGIRSHLTAFDVQGADVDVALALDWEGPPEYSRLRAFADGVASGLAERSAAGRSSYLLLDADIAQTLGRLLKEEIGIRGDLLVIDGVRLWDFDFVDLGRVRSPSNTVPVTIKSLIFGDDLEAARRGR